jgi:hypothetical protein
MARKKLTLASSRGSGRHEDRAILACQSPLGPKSPGSVPECLKCALEMSVTVMETTADLPLSGKVAKTSWDTEDEPIELGKLLRSDDRV